MPVKTKALFLDRDGVINVDRGYVCARADFEFMDGIFDLCREAKARGYLLIIVTNQSGIGRGYYTEEEFHALMGWVQEEFARQNAAIDAVYYCPYHIEASIERYCKDSEDRKPNPGMLLKAQEKFNVDMAASLIVGDNEKDIQAGTAAGLGKTILLRDVHEGSVASAATHVIRSLAEAEAHL